jgi:hypothetical protein
VMPRIATAGASALAVAIAALPAVRT